MQSVDNTVNATLSAQMRGALDAAYTVAREAHESPAGRAWNLSKDFRNALERISASSSSASTGFTNIITCLTVKIVRPELDIRYHQVQIGAPFNFRGYSEKVIYPWLFAKRFEGAKSGWQTRTFERPKPYKLDFDENIGKIKVPFLTCFDEVQEKGADASEGLAFLLYGQIILREKGTLILSEPTKYLGDNISDIIHLFQKHFNQSYDGHGASRLPVLAVYAVYQAIVEQVGRYHDKTLLPLNRHTAADTRTGAYGDIEVTRDDYSVFEALEVKHNIRFDSHLVEATARKVEGAGLDRYYMLTTHRDCKPGDMMVSQLKSLREITGCQIIVNGVLPTLQYYLRLVDNPSAIFPRYAELLKAEPAISHEHRAAWNGLIMESTALYDGRLIG